MIWHQCQHRVCARKMNPHGGVFTSTQATKCLQVVLGLRLCSDQVSTISPSPPQAYKQAQLPTGSITHTSLPSPASAAWLCSVTRTGQPHRLSRSNFTASLCSMSGEDSKVLLDWFREDGVSASLFITVSTKSRQAFLLLQHQRREFGYRKA